jgi:hypothetical protein
VGPDINKVVFQAGALASYSHGDCSLKDGEEDTDHSPTIIEDESDSELGPAGRSVDVDIMDVSLLSL